MQIEKAPPYFSFVILYFLVVLGLPDSVFGATYFLAKKGDEVVHVAGTIHLTTGEFSDSSSYEIAKRFDNLAFEVDPDGGFLGKTHDLMETGPRLKDLAQIPEYQDFVNEYLDVIKNPVDVNNLSVYQAYLLAGVINWMNVSNKFDAYNGTELSLKNLLPKKKIIGIENGNDILAFNKLPLEVISNLISNKLHARMSKSAIKHVEDSFNNGRCDYVAQWINDIDANLSGRMARNFFLSIRNRYMEEQIIKLNKQYPNTLFLVGVDHVCGESNILDLLRKDGYEVVQVK